MIKITNDRSGSPATRSRSEAKAKSEHGQQAPVGTLVGRSGASRLGQIPARAGSPDRAVAGRSIRSSFSQAAPTSPRTQKTGATGQSGATSGSDATLANVAETTDAAAPFIETSQVSGEISVSMPDDSVISRLNADVRNAEIFSEFVLYAQSFSVNGVALRYTDEKLVALGKLPEIEAAGELSGIDAAGELSGMTAADELADGKLKYVFMEVGNRTAGLQHVVKKHGDEFARAGIEMHAIPAVLVHALVSGKQTGAQGKGTDKMPRPIYSVQYDNKDLYIAITTGNNGYIVSANMSSKKKLSPEPDGSK